jgi:hypothetical protein
MRLALSGVEYTLKLSGAGAVRLTAALWSLATTQQKSKGKARLASLLKSGKELKVFNITEAELATFAKEAKRYGVLYAVIKGTKDNPDELVDIMVKAEDAAKINRIVERLEYGKFDESEVVVEAERELAVRDGDKEAADKGVQAKDTTELLKELAGSAGREEGSENAYTNPTAAKTAGPAPSEPSSERDGHQQDRSTAEKDSAGQEVDTQPEKQASKTREGRGFADERERSSVKQKIEDKRQERSERSKSPDQPAKPGQTKHQVPQANKRRNTKTKPEKGR